MFDVNLAFWNLLNLCCAMTFQDQLKRAVNLPVWPPRRIVSLVPSQTELLYTLGLEAETVGITKFCVHPSAWFQEKKRVGGTKTVDLKKVAGLSPDLILGNKEENDKSQIEALAAHFPVWMSDVRNLEDACDMIDRVGELTGKTAQSTALTVDIRHRFAQWQLSNPTFLRRRAVYFIWRKPFIVAAGETYIDAMLQLAGFDNVFAHLTRYPNVDLADLAAAAPEVILLSSEPYPFAEKHFAPFREACPQAHLQLVDGEMFSWYGSRLLQVPSYFCALQASLTHQTDHSNGK